jgi:uncharacterized cupredoxin-like copper-binding protein
MSGYILGLLIICTSLVFVSSFFYKNKDSSMNNMVYVMAYSMSIGLTLGFYFGAFYKEDLLIATLLSILFGGIAGLLIGTKLHFHLMIEGLFSGLMAGMMGAMLTTMLSVKQAQFLIIIGVLLTVGITILCILQFLSETLNERSYNVIMLLGCVILLMVFIKFPNEIIKENKNASNQHEQHSPSSGTKNNTNQMQREQETVEVFNWGVGIKNYRYLSSNVILKRDQKVLLTLINEDSVEHDIEISPFSFEQIDVQKNMDHYNHAKKTSVFHLHVEPKGKNSLSFIPKKSGIYTYYCTIPGHKESGMIGKIKVS